MRDLMRILLNFMMMFVMFTFKKCACQRGSLSGEIINPFEQDAFSMTNLCGAINILPNNYGRVNQLGIFGSIDGITTRTAVVEEQNGILSLLKTMPVGAPAPYNKMVKRKARSFYITHNTLDDIIRPEEFSGVREFGQPNQMKTLASTMNKHLQTAKDKFSITIEHMRMGALKGIILDADASTIYNLYTEFGITPKIISFELDVAGTDVTAKCRELLRYIEDHLQGEQMTEVRVLVSAEFFDALISHVNVQKFYVNWQAAAQMSGTDPRKGFIFAGVTFEEYRGVATDENGVSRRFIASGEGHAFPMGTMNTFKQIYAPGNFIETVNTPGIELYVKQVMEGMGRWVDLHIESNPLPLCMRPGVLVKVTLT
jgi:hypothetical protein